MSDFREDGGQATDRGQAAGYPPKIRRALRGGPHTGTFMRYRSRPHAAAEAPAEVPAPDGTLAEWHEMTPGQQVTAWAQLRAWVTWLTDRYELTVEDRLPRCWAGHPGLVEELWALRAWRLEIYGGQPSAGQAARYWHAELERVLHAATTRYASGCRAGHRSAAVLVANDKELQQRWAQAYFLAGIPPADVAAGRARKTDGWVSPAEMAVAFDVGDATPLPGRRDYMTYRGAWWAPASAGWIQMPGMAATSAG
jgi:hypothetical protein